MLVSAAPSCPRCGLANTLQGIFCAGCGLYLRDHTASVERVTFTRRIFGSWLLEGILIVITLVIGWLIWMIFTAQKGQSPAKSLTGIYIIEVETGRVAGASTVWIRDVLLKLIVAGIIPFGQVVDLVWAFFDRDRQALHDKAVKTVVVYAPNAVPEDMQHLDGAPVRFRAPPVFPQAPDGTTTVTDVGEQQRELKRLHDEDLISEDEYERKRADLVSRL